MAMELARKVKTARLLRDLSQSELAKRAGVSVSTLIRIEGGKGARPHRRTLRRLAAALGTTPAWLTDGSQGLSGFGLIDAGGGGQRGSGALPSDGAAAPERAAMGDVRELLRRAIRAVERAGGAVGPSRPPGGAGAFLPDDGSPGTARMAPVFDIGADLDRDWQDGDLPVGTGHDERPAFNDDPSGFWCVVHGDSMEPDLSDGDLLYFSPEQSRPADGDICLVRTHDFATVKRVFGLGGAVARLAASNPRYPDRAVDLRDEVVQLHKAICFVRMLG